MSEPTKTIEGWYALHDFRQFNWPAWKAADPADRESALVEWRALSQSHRELSSVGQGGYGAFTIAGHKADLLWLHFRPTLSELTEAKTAFSRTRLADFTTTPYSYVSIVELSSYLAQPGVPPDDDPKLLPRLHPNPPATSSICFYPMNKRREGIDNWYMLDMQKRVELMRQHGLIGREYAGKVSQVITGSMGLDDWEWGVTLYADDPLQFKKLIYEMRFDETSARFAEFGPFYVGQSATDEDIIRQLTIETRSM